ncbi:MAG: hypothetical protein HC786_32105 [Richelia sp. CSU_2_1]|nr:hypothetical protein [Microcoleus sp. SU_5_6]NJR26415.1 hypothetical protein [Richelia sp. CSU_2_1]
MSKLSPECFWLTTIDYQRERAGTGAPPLPTINYQLSTGEGGHGASPLPTIDYQLFAIAPKASNVAF